MNQLKKGMLSIGPGTSPNNSSSLVVHHVSIAIHVLAVTLHDSLLEVSHKFTQVLTVRHDAFRLRAVKIVVPNRNQCQKYRHILFKICLGKVLIHSMRPTKQVFKVIVTDTQCDGQAYSAPQ